MKISQKKTIALMLLIIIKIELIGIPYVILFGATHLPLAQLFSTLFVQPIYVNIWILLMAL